MAASIPFLGPVTAPSSKGAASATRGDGKREVAKLFLGADVGFRVAVKGGGGGATGAKVTSGVLGIYR